MIDNKQKQQGFTLIEVLIALFIFAILSVITVEGLHSVIENYHSVNKRQEVLQQLALATVLMRRDVSQIVLYSAVDSKGRRAESLNSSGNGFSFLRTGAINPFYLFRQSDLLQINYQLNNGQLVRIARSVDSNNEGQSLQFVLLDNVADISVHYMETPKITTSEWPPTASNQNIRPPALPLAIQITITFKSGTDLQLILPLASRRQYDAIPKT